MDRNYKKIPNSSGVYFITLDIFKIGEPSTEEIVYVGSSTNLYVRWKAHNVYKDLHAVFDQPIIRFYFVSMSKGFYDYEIKLIKKLNPILNKQHKSNAQVF